MVSDLDFNANVKTTWVPAGGIASIAAPTAAELNAGSVVALEGRLTPDGVDTTPDTAAVDNRSLASRYGTEQVGSSSVKIAVKYKAMVATASDTVAQTLIYQAEGYLVIRRDLPVTTAYAAGQKVEVYPVQCAEPQPATPAVNALQIWTVPMMMTADPRTRSNPATVA